MYSRRCASNSSTPNASELCRMGPAPRVVGAARLRDLPGFIPRWQRSRAAVCAATEAERVTGRRQLAGLARATLLMETRPEGPGARFGGGRPCPPEVAASDATSSAKAEGRDGARGRAPLRLRTAIRAAPGTLRSMSRCSPRGARAVGLGWQYTWH